MFLFLWTVSLILYFNLLINTRTLLGRKVTRQTPRPRPGNCSPGGADFCRAGPEGAGGSAEGQDVQLVFTAQLLVNEALVGKRTPVAPRVIWSLPSPLMLWLGPLGWDENCAETGSLKTQLSSPRLTFSCCPWGHRDLGGAPYLPIPACPWLCMVRVGPGWSASSGDWLSLPLTADPRSLLEQPPHTWVMDVGGMSTHFRMRNGWTLTVAFTCGTQGGAQRWGAAVAVLAVWVGDGVMGAGPASWVFSGSAWWVSTSKIMLPSPSWWESLFLGMLIRWPGPSWRRKGQTFFYILSS